MLKITKEAYINEEEYLRLTIAGFKPLNGYRTTLDYFYLSEPLVIRLSIFKLGMDTCVPLRMEKLMRKHKSNKMYQMSYTTSAGRNIVIDFMSLDNLLNKLTRAIEEHNNGNNINK